MPALSVIEGWSGRNATASAGFKRAMRKFTVSTDSGSDDKGVVLYAIDERTGVAIPRPGDRHPTDVSMHCDTIKCDPIGPYLWSVEAEYVGNWAGQYDLPTTAVLQLQEARYAQRIWKDRANNPIVNSSGEPIHEAQHDFAFPVLVATRYEPTFDVTAWAAYSDTVNPDAFFNFLSGQWRMYPILGTQIVPSEAAEHDVSLRYWQVIYRMELRQPDWQMHYLDEGYRELTGIDDDGNPIYRLITDSEGKPINQPVMLDGDGHILPAGVEPRYRSFWEYFPSPYPWSELDLL